MASQAPMASLGCEDKEQQAHVSDLRLPEVDTYSRVVPSQCTAVGRAERSASCSVWDTEQSPNSVTAMITKSCASNRSKPLNFEREKSEGLHWLVEQPAR